MLLSDLAKRALPEAVPTAADGGVPCASCRRVASGQAPHIAAPALFLDPSVQEDVGTFGYDVSFAGGLLLDKTTRRKLRAPLAAVAAGEVPGSLKHGLPAAAQVPGCAAPGP